MDDLAPDWEIIAQKTNAPVRNLIAIMLQMFLLTAPVGHSSVTYTLRHRATGAIRKVTAKSAGEAAARVVAGQFDPEG